jgi:hypothetical protein
MVEEIIGKNSSIREQKRTMIYLENIFYFGSFYSKGILNFF